MKKKSRPIVSANLSEIAFLIYKKVNRVRDKGWFSKFVSESLVDKYGKDFEQNINKDFLVELQERRNKIEEEIKKVVEKLRKVR